MSMKTSFTIDMNHAANSYSSCRDEIIKAMNNKDYSVSGKKNAIQNIIGRHNDLVNRYRADIIKAVTDKVSFLDGDEKETLQRRYRDTSYRAALSNTLDVLKLCAGTVAPDDMAAMLSMFENDPMAITAIQKTIENYAREAGQNQFSYTGVIPADNRGKRQERLRKLETTLLHELDGLTLEMPAHGLDEETAKDTFDPHEIPMQIVLEVNSTIDYMNHCNPDLTEYTPGAGQVGIDFKTAYNHALNP